MSALPKRHIRHAGRIYVSPAHAGDIMGVSRTTIKRWHQKGFIEGTIISPGRSSQKRLYILKSSLRKSLLQYKCDSCGKTVKTVQLRDPEKKRFCSRECCDKWWNLNRPVSSDGTRKQTRI